MRWNGGGHSTDKPLALIGKGVTFDTGGISIKPAAGMESMKWDMGGAGAVAGAMIALASRKAKANVIGLCGLVENMPSGSATRPGDVVTSMNGQTIEVINTDAEGRLVLADVMTYRPAQARREADGRSGDPDRRDAGCTRPEHGGLFANDDTLAAELTAAGSETGEKLVADAARRCLRPADRLARSPTSRTSARARPARSLRRNSSSASSRRGSNGPTSTSPAWCGATSPAPPSTRARPRSACACSTASWS